METCQETVTAWNHMVETIYIDTQDLELSCLEQQNLLPSSRLLAFDTTVTCRHLEQSAALRCGTLWEER
jgi:hypothetical protein